MYHNIRGEIMRFKTVEEIPERYELIMESFIERGIIATDAGELEYPLTEDMLYLLKIMQRMN